MSGSKGPPAKGKLVVDRVQTGVRVEQRILKVLKGLAEYHDLSLGDLLEGIVLHAFEGKSPFGDKASLEVIADLKRIYGLDLDAVNGQRGVTANTALRLARYFGTTPQVWLNLQKIWELRREQIEFGRRIAERVQPRQTMAPREEARTDASS